MTESPVSGGTAPASALFPPKGMQQIVDIFGNIKDYIQADDSLSPNWQMNFLSHASLPFPAVLSFDHSQSVSHFCCHKLLVRIFEGVFAEIQSNGLQSQVSSFGGCFSFRPQRTGRKLSTHSWGIAIDLNSETNVQGTDGNMSPDIIAIFRKAGFEWGGSWPGKIRDPMHFQFCSGY